MDHRLIRRCHNAWQYCADGGAEFLAAFRPCDLCRSICCKRSSLGAHRPSARTTGGAGRGSSSKLSLSVVYRHHQLNRISSRCKQRVSHTRPAAFSVASLAVSALKMIRPALCLKSHLRHWYSHYSSGRQRSLACLLRLLILRPPE